MKIKKIYFDMDGVLADFDRGIRELCGMHPLDQANKTEADDDRMWDAVRTAEHFYDRLELMPGAKDMFYYATHKYHQNVEILSGIPKPRRGILHAGEDKTAWIHRLLKPDMTVHIVYREEKKNYCLGRDYVLIDDLEKNIREWESYGGTGILFRSAEDTVKRLREIEIELGGNRLLSTPISGWSTFEPGNRVFELSFISDVADPWLSALTKGIQENTNALLYGDEEGTSFEVTVDKEHLTVVHDAMDGIHKYEYPIGIREFSRLLCDDIERDVDAWADWDCESYGGDEGKRTAELAKKKDRLLKEIENLRDTGR